jgi:hypothetical protein
MTEKNPLRVAAHNLGEPMAVRPRVWSCAERRAKDGQESLVLRAAMVRMLHDAQIFFP